MAPQAKFVAKLFGAFSFSEGRGDDFNRVEIRGNSGTDARKRAFNKRGEQYLLIKSPPASGKSRALMFIALDKLHNQNLKQAIIVVPEKSIGGSFMDEPLSQFGFWADWEVKPQWNLCNAPGPDEERVDPSKIKAVGQFLASDDKVLVCTHATFRFAVEQLGVEAFDGRLIAVDEFHHVSASADNRLGSQLADFIRRDKAHIVAMTGSYFRGDAVPVLTPEDEAKFETVTYTYYEQLNGYEHLKALNIGYFFYTGRYLTAIEAVFDSTKKTIVHIPSVNSRESTKDKIKEVEEIMEYLGEWQGADPQTGFHHVKLPEGRIVKIADLVDDSDALLAELGVEPQSDDDIRILRHVQTAEERRAAEEIATREKCPDFGKFQPLFHQVQQELDSGIRATRPFELKAEIRPGAFFIVGGQVAYVAEMGDVFTTEHGRSDARLRVIFDNGTQSNMLMRSLQRSLNKDDAGRRITDPVAGPLFGGSAEDGDDASGTIYVLRSKSDHPVVAEHRELVHKIGVTNMKVSQRIAGARLQPTFLMADVEVIAEYQLFNINRTKLERLIHKVFGAAQLDLSVPDRFGNLVQPQEWFLVPLAAIDEAVERIRDGSITNYRYDPSEARLVGG